MPVLRKTLPADQKFAILRLDGDIYQSTVDVLYNMYDHVSIGGKVIIDDWEGFPARGACEDFFRVHKMNPEVTKIDRLSAYWTKTVEVEIQYWRYEQLQFKDENLKDTSKVVNVQP